MAGTSASGHTKRPVAELLTEPALTEELLAAAIALMAWAGVAVGAWAAGRGIVPAWPALSGVLLTLLASAVFLGFARRTRWLLPAVGLLYCLLGIHAEREYTARAVKEPELVELRALAVADPEPLTAGWSLQVRAEGGLRYELVGFGSQGFALAQVGFGQRLSVEGRARSIGDRRWLRSRHLSGTISVAEVKVVGATSRWFALPQLMREAIVDGGEALPRSAQALYHGLVVGDDRFQTLGQKTTFRVAGLTHLLAVSGQNVAFVLAVAEPVLRRTRLRWRLPLSLTVLLCFAIVTRAEPSVLRATMTTAIAVWASCSGRRSSGVQAMALAILALLAIDPFLAGVVGFQLSVAASAGILVLAPPLARRLPLPQWLAQPLAVTAAAQVAVSPLLITYFGPISLASLPANLLAGWAAGLVMTLGLTVGVVAGLGPVSVAGVLQFPTSLLLWWIDLVARLAVAVPLPLLDLSGLMAAVLLLFVARRCDARWQRWVIRVAFCCLVVAYMPRAPSEPAAVADGASYWPGGAGRPSVLLVESHASSVVPESVLAAGIRHVDIVVFEAGGRRQGNLAMALDEVLSIGALRAPPDHRIQPAIRVTEQTSWSVVGGVMTVAPSRDGSRLDITLAADETDP